MTSAVDIVRERARAKVNLTLSIRGRRPDGYHELDSLVAFADVGDDVVVHGHGAFRLLVDGPFAGAIEGENLVSRAVARAVQAEPRLVAGTVRVTKRLPVAAGIGGGSADAGAVLRALRRGNPTVSDAVDWNAIARGLGADVGVCLTNRSAMMRGFGDVVAPLAGFPAVPAVLVNPRVPVPVDKTAAVFRALAAPPLDGAFRRDDSDPRFADIGEVLAYVGERGNDLEAPASRVMPVVGDVLDALSALRGAEAVRLSGAGPTAFALFLRACDAADAAAELTRRRPDWWVVATTIGDGDRGPADPSEL